MQSVFISRALQNTGRHILQKWTEYAHEINNHLQQVRATAVQRRKKETNNTVLEISFNLEERKYWMLLEFVAGGYLLSHHMRYIFDCTACR